MSRIHVSFIKCSRTDNSVVYQVHSPDFHDSQLIGEIRFDLLERRYQFVPMGVLEGKSVIPPYVFDLPEAQRDAVIEQEFSACSYGGWTSRIARMANRLLDKDEFPNEVFGVT